MKITRLKVAGWFVVLCGVLVTAFSNRIVFPGLERLLGIETIVGRENVFYQPDGSYYFTNPGSDGALDSFGGSYRRSDLLLRHFAASSSQKDT